MAPRPFFGRNITTLPIEPGPKACLPGDLSTALVLFCFPPAEAAPAPFPLAMRYERDDGQQWQWPPAAAMAERVRPLDPAIVGMNT